MSRRVAGVAAMGLLLAGCGAAMHRYPLREVVWDDPDRGPFTPMPDERDVPYYWDAMDHMIFRPLADVWTVELQQPSINVNAYDEVPDSSWFVNRIGRRPMSPADVARGACGPEDGSPPPPWTVTGGKTGGASPGFFVRDGAGVRYLFKTDREGQPEQSSAADAIVAAVFHAAGYHVPCNRVVYGAPEAFVVEDGAELRSHWDERRPMTAADVAEVLAAAAHDAGGRARGVMSRFIDGRPLGPWNYLGTWDQDPNDVVPHERRRELRGSYVLDAWVDHWDARQDNTLAAWMETDAGDGGYVRHYLLDFGDSLGMMDGNHRRSPRFGHSAYLDIGDIVADTLTFGVVTRPWDGRRPRPVLGYFDAEHFDPETWTPQYWNGALDRRTEGDVAWGARLLARFSDAHVHALVALGRYSDPAVAEAMERILKERRDRLLARYLARLSPLADVAAGESPDGRAAVCATDLGVQAGVEPPRAFAGRLHRGLELAPEPVSVQADGARVCATLPHVEGAGRPRDYLVLDLAPVEPGPGPLRIHAYATGRDRVRVVALERPASGEPPRP